MELIRPFERLGKNDAHLAGGKGASLGEMTQAGILVPPGYVILSDSFEQFIRETQLVAEIDSIIDKVNHHEMESVERASETIQALIMRAKMPKDIEKEIELHFKKLNAKFVAVRSSATAEDSSEAAWAGQLDSFLNTTEKTLLENVKKCWASLFTPRAIFYRFEKKLHQTKISVAVVVQKMVESEISGIGFSVHPVTQDYNQMIIEGGLGLGEAIVSGQITPDSYVIEKKPFRILEKNISEQSRGIFRKPQGGNEWKDIPAEEGAKQKLSDAQVLELGKMVLRIEEHYGFPVDTEWAFEKGKFYIVQSRPITTLTNKPPADSADGKKKVESKLVFEKSISRDWGIIYAELWNRVFTHDFEKQIGWGYSEVVFEGKDQFITVYRAPAEHIDGMRTHILGQISQKSDWLINHAKTVTLDTLAILEWVQTIQQKPYSAYTNNELASILRAFWEKNLLIGPRFIMMLWFPIQMENYPDWRKYDKSIKAAIQARTEIEKIGPVADTLTREIAVEVCHRGGIDSSLERYISYMELLDFLEKGKKINVKKLKERQCYFLVTKEGIISTPLSNYLHSLGFSLHTINVSTLKEIKGTSAYPGKAKGIARVVRNKDQFTRIQEGNILITGMTTPDFVPILKKVSAFVTDEGGVTCHASIVARELKKPCIIGTKVATQAIQDGDEVEVDANKGVVRILDPPNEKPESFLFRSRYIPSTVPILYFWSWPVEEEIGIPQGRIVNIWDNGNYTGVWEKKRFDEIGEKVVTNLLNTIQNHQKIRDSGINAGKKVVEHCQQFSSNVGSAKPNEFVSFLTELEKKYHIFARKNMVYWIFSSPVLEARVKEALKEFGPEDYSAIFTTMSKSPISSYSQIEEMEFDKIVQLARKKGLENSEVKKRIQTFSQKYFWFPYEYVGPTIWTPKEVTKRIQEELKKKKSIQSNDDVQKEQEACIKKYNLSQSTVNLFKVMQLSALMQDDRKLYNVQVCYYLNEIILPEIGKRIGATPPEMRYADNTIIQEWANGKNIRKRLKVRKNFFVAVEDGWDIDIYEGKKGRDYLKKEEIKLTVNTEGIAQVNGQSSYPGIVRGKARILLTSSHGETFEPGDVLITGMTTPDFAPLMKKAAAIVTDEGGITSHAAIVARELKKPCIIGVKIATKVFKDGDIVEVDANTGIVRKLNF